jgi:thiosulfate reductase cytochrome b subunit
MSATPGAGAPSTPAQPEVRVPEPEVTAPEVVPEPPTSSPAPPATAGPRRRAGLSATAGTASHTAANTAAGPIADTGTAAGTAAGAEAPAGSVPKAFPDAGSEAPTVSVPEVRERPQATVPLAPSEPPRPAVEPKPTRRLPQGRVRLWGGPILGILVLALILIPTARWLRGLDGVADFLTTYPGEAPLPDSAPVGLPAWVGWQHFFNVFLMVLIVRSGLLVRWTKRPDAFFTRTIGPRPQKAAKISLNLWLHLSLDVLWLLNGVIYVTLLFATGQWMRIVPTTWDVFPNAVSAALQYASMDWPTENGWLNYNGLQQIAYFTTVFIAAPLAIITGVRMSNLWPKDAAISRVYRVEWARALHFPTMLYFVIFTVTHVVLVLATGALRNLNHMYTSRDTTDWWGVGVFALSALIIAGAFAAARPILLAPLASTMGKVGR